jgi:hypothetical protein
VGKRIYVYRSGATDNCALTGTKNDPRLPSAHAPNNWRFWMQGGRCGFDVRAAVHGIGTQGYYLFKGSRTLLRGRPAVTSRLVSQGGRSHA